MTHFAISRRTLAHGVTGALASVLLAGCATHVAPSAGLSAAEAQAALAKGKTQRAIDHAEAAVQTEPRNAAYRVMLGEAYLDAGRFIAASSTFSDAFALGERSPQTALSYALALTGAGLHNEALAVLDAYDGQMPAADLGLAMALAGAPQRGIQVLETGIRAGENSPVIRQNLAYSYALAGRWRDARIMAAQDLRADLVGGRMEEWNRTASPFDWQLRVAKLLDVPAGVRDPGQPVQLALANNPSIDQLGAEALRAEAAAPEPSIAADPFEAELPAVLAAAGIGLIPPASPERLSPTRLSMDAHPLISGAILPAIAPIALARPAPAPLPPLTLPESAEPQHAAFSAPAIAATLRAFDIAFAGEAPRLAPPAAVQPPRAAPARPAARDHLVQLGSFFTRESAERAQAIYLRRHPELARHRMVITQAIVRGKHYWRVAAADFSAQESRGICGTMRARGQGCLAYAASRPLPGAAPTGIMLARR